MSGSCRIGETTFRSWGILRQGKERKCRKVPVVEVEGGWGGGATLQGTPEALLRPYPFLFHSGAREAALRTKMRTTRTTEDVRTPWKGPSQFEGPSMSSFLHYFLPFLLTNPAGASGAHSTAADPNAGNRYIGLVCSVRWRISGRGRGSYEDDL